MGRIRVTGRFYLFLAIILVGAFFILQPYLSFGASETLITMGTSSYSLALEGVVVRDEAVASFEGNGRVVYLADEGAHVEPGDGICEVYTQAYADKELARLNSIRTEIRAYHRQLLSNIIDNNLQRLEDNVQAEALELKRLVNRNAIGNLVGIERQLESTMLDRQDYLQQNKREDHKLTRLYDDEAESRTRIASWRQLKGADKAGVVTFYLDGYESLLTFDNLPNLTVADIDMVLNKRPMPTTPNARLRQNVYKTVTTDKWYIVLLSRNPNWNVVRDQTFQMQMQGVNGFAFTGTVRWVQKNPNGVLAQLEVNSDLGPMLNHRSGKIDLSVSVVGFTVPPKAVYNQDGQTGLMISDVQGGTFVPVEVLTQNSQYALVQPLVEGTLSSGMRVMLQ